MLWGGLVVHSKTGRAAPPGHRVASHGLHGARDGTTLLIELRLEDGRN
jgi:hypothetical protein